MLRILSMLLVLAVPFANAAEFIVSSDVLRSSGEVPPLGANNWGRVGAVEWAANNFLHNSGNEPVHWRNLHRAARVGPGWFEIDGPGTSWYDLWASGFLSDAEVRIYRLVDKDGQPLPVENDSLDVSQADHVQFVGRTRVIPEGSPGFPDGGWIANGYADVHPNARIRHGNTMCTDVSGIENGREYWYTVHAIGPGDTLSPPSSEISATPEAGLATPPRLLVAGQHDRLPEIRRGQRFEFTPRTHGGRAPLRWKMVDGSLPQGLDLNAETGRIAGIAAADGRIERIVLEVTDAEGRGERRAYGSEPSEGGPADKKVELAPPRELHAVAGDGCVTLSWRPSPSAEVVGYRIRRSVQPRARQEQRVYLEKGAPALHAWDYVVLSRKFEPFQMKYVNSRMRGMGNEMNATGWYWQSEGDLEFSLAPHPQPVPKEMVDPGEACMQIDAATGPQRIWQHVMIGTERAGESRWYGQLEPCRRYRMEVWLRQEGLVDGKVEFALAAGNQGYRDIRTVFVVKNEWMRCTCEFTAPERPREDWHFGPQFSFAGPGRLWLDNARVFRVDDPEDARKPYTPNATVLDELVRSQPVEGRKGVHRIWFLKRDATMDSILSWHANSSVSVDWRTSLEPTMDMTLPMGLEFDLWTGHSAATRMRPWLVLQHILHDENDWRNLVEYLAAPYDPATDTPQSKPWAYRRTVQRGVAAPWTDEFAEIIVEFGNETWHNGVFPDWLGFSKYHFVHQGGKEYGLFTRYLIAEAKKSPYWKSEGLEGKIRFALGANYDGRVDDRGGVRGYGEEAMGVNPLAGDLSHANYVGPKWETGDARGDSLDDAGFQQCLVSFWTSVRGQELRMSEARAALAERGADYRTTAYEGGPGGYALPGRASPRQVEINEHYGKSLAQAVGALDTWLGSYLLGWSDQCFFSYGQGSHWNSHGIFADGFRPSVGWLAMTLRNRYARGEMVEVISSGVPTMKRGSEAIPLVGAYAMRDGRRWSVFLLSRTLDGSVPVTVRLPFDRVKSITLHTLAGDPRDTHLEASRIELQTRELAASVADGGTLTVEGGLPPGCIYLYVIEAAP